MIPSKTMLNSFNQECFIYFYLLKIKNCLEHPEIVKLHKEQLCNFEIKYIELLRLNLILEFTNV